MKDEALTQDYLKSVIKYDEDTGSITWNRSKLLNRNGLKADHVRNDGYASIGLKGRPYYSHRIAWIYMTGESSKKEIDHINGIKSDNRFENLRAATHAENTKNRLINFSNKSGFKGVFFNNRTKKWQATIGLSGHNKYLGTFDDPKDAHKAYCKAAIKYHGEFANFG